MTLNALCMLCSDTGFQKLESGPALPRCMYSAFDRGAANARVGMLRVYDSTNEADFVFTMFSFRITISGCYMHVERMTSTSPKSIKMKGYKYQ